jgi:hypothetical protein
VFNPSGGVARTLAGRHFHRHRGARLHDLRSRLRR